MRRSCLFLVLLALLGVTVAATATAAAVRLEKPRTGQLLSAAFDVVQPCEVTVEAVGVVLKLSEEYLATAWILDATTRRPVWSLDARERELMSQSRFLRHALEKVRLAPGRYVLYLYGGTEWRSAEPFRRFSNVLNDLADLLSREDPGGDPQPYLDQCWIAVTPVSGVAADALRPSTAAPGVAAPGAVAGALIDLTRAPDDTSLAQAFRLTRPTALRVRAYAESARDTTRLRDLAWIEDVATGGPAWQIEGKLTRPAGGARKNRFFDGEVRLPAGDYIARFVTDGSHAWNAWNAPPPLDPDAWGLAVFAGSGFAPGDLQPIPLTAVRQPPSLLASLTMARDGEHRRQEFALANPARVRIEALLEGAGDEMADRCWIAEASGTRKVWELEYDATERAGGALKNRRFVGEIELPAGRYVAHVRCDDSHAFGTWNATPPPEPWKWGMTVRLVGR